MLIAETRGRTIEEVVDNEDYLTSAVFGHLRYIPPGIFWPQLFQCALGMEDGSTLAHTLRERGIDLTSYSRLATHFWPSHPKLGEPDLILQFSGPSVPNVYILIEVKLNAGKGGSGEKDQLGRYMRLLDDLETLADFNASPGDHRLLVYLTPREVFSELQASLETMPDRAIYRDRMFRLQWADIADLAKTLAESMPTPLDGGAAAWSKLILTAVSKFLNRRNLAYFHGFDTACLDEMIQVRVAPFCEEPVAADHMFDGMRQLSALQSIRVQRGNWV